MRTEGSITFPCLTYIFFLMLNFHCFSGWPFVHPVKNEFTTQENNQVGIDKTLWIASIHVKFINTSENDRTSFHGREVEIVIFSPSMQIEMWKRKTCARCFRCFIFGSLLLLLFSWRHAKTCFCLHRTVR